MQTVEQEPQKHAWTTPMLTVLGIDSTASGPVTLNIEGQGTFPTVYVAPQSS